MGNTGKNKSGVLMLIATLTAILIVLNVALSNMSTVIALGLGLE